MAIRHVRCPLCAAQDSPPYKTIEGFAYYECHNCDFIFIDPRFYARIDKGIAIVEYDPNYWSFEVADARVRSWGVALARVAEIILYCRIPIERFVDIGSGPGYLLDALSWAMPTSASKFYAVELFPPPIEQRTAHPNYIVGSIAAARQTFQAGCCIEVIEHLTPKMMRKFAAELYAASSPGACYIFNTGLTEFVRKEDPSYVDPTRRGHVSIWSVEAARRIFEEPKFRVHPIPGKTWAFAVEVQPRPPAPAGPLTNRIWSPCPENLAMLNDPKTGAVMYILGIDTARAYIT